MFMTGALHAIVLHSNRQGRRIVGSWNKLHPENLKMWRTVDYMEMETFVGLHIIAGAYRSQFRSLEDLWSTRDGYPIMKSTMSLRRFEQLNVLFVSTTYRRETEQITSPHFDMYLSNSTINFPSSGLQMRT
jgi:hypothetical protein